MKKNVILLTLITAFGLIFGCSDDNVTSPKSDTGTLRVLLTDATAAYDEVNVTFSEVSVHLGSEISEADSLSNWIVISDEVKTFDLLTLSNGVTSLLGEKTLDEGHYTQLRLTLTDAVVVVDGTPYKLDVPSGVLKFVSGFDIKAETPMELIVDFDAARSIHQTVKNGDYKLKPTIRIIKQIEAGSIGGTVINYSNLPVAYAIAGADTITATPVNSDNGRFTLAFLPVGTYSVAVTDTLGLVFTNSSVSVTLGVKTNLGDITLH